MISFISLCNLQSYYSICWCLIFMCWLSEFSVLEWIETTRKTAHNSPLDNRTLSWSHLAFSCASFPCSLFPQTLNPNPIFFRVLVLTRGTFAFRVQQAGSSPESTWEGSITLLIPAYFCYFPRQFISRFGKFFDPMFEGLVDDEQFLIVLIIVWLSLLFRSFFRLTHKHSFSQIRLLRRCHHFDC